MFSRLLPVLELQFIDETGSKGATTVKAPIDTTYAVLDANASALASLLLPLTGCTLIRQRIIYKAVSIPSVAPLEGSAIVNAGMFFLEDETGNNQVLFSVPGILDSKLVSSGVGAGVLIDTSDTDVLTLLNTFVSQGFVNPFGVICDSLVAAYRQSRT